MKEFLTITIDVEPDCSPNWQYSNPLTFTGVSQGIAARLQPLFNKYNVTPTYLINNVVLEDAGSISVFKNLPGKFELGTHLHPEFMEPKKQHHDYAGKKGVANCCFYPPEIEFEKINNITKLFKKQFGYAPTSFRAGRFSAGSNTILSLKKLNYKVDTSVTPNVKWDDRTREKPVDFRKAPDKPYWIGDQGMTRPSIDQTLLEVPVTITRQKLSPLEIAKYIFTKKRIPYKAARPLWLRPVFSGRREFADIAETIKNTHFKNDIVVYNMMFHNVEVIPGMSPYSKTEADCMRYLDDLAWFLEYCAENKIHGVGLSSLYEFYRNR